jgi:hypothetical protein
MPRRERQPAGHCAFWWNVILDPKPVNEPRERDEAAVHHRPSPGAAFSVDLLDVHYLTLGN